ncbi:UDP-N-acetylmuramoyl-tripeptide--D-alanyl-D-alanine ligase [Maritimibacter sp. UBA3975]|uniref:UDP-N-acetylmuramoyl-tripeptide--D-alanyl-D- alanine ligase n=1 Tax=Maritimibacter sp. UBA3975 TaxID=1946833 RepID=UPI000C098518|nr:UDP-N-acetylmuramoyl-tripeptide--D-alanyl-D-alanine ligase [Maritimibacter sp. UBA3975]MAM61614.1 UDP-N-acetylmuramoyl-tripeptide--D-alanyl-D-alanine ligase [Maritimibacter sp.]|tara:strand:- start:11169 stop:12593 length:1425 start_codon:yes stop_codon:yes gene_type:complete
MNLWTAAEAAAATGGNATGDWTVSGVSIDTRTIQPGDLFVALTDVRDGHDFVADALAKGAGAAMVSRIPDGVKDTAPLLVVDDVLAALERLGMAGRKRTQARVVAVTGSVGKTSTKEMLATVLDRQARCHAAEASYNNQWGVPLTLARMPRETDFAVIEIGMNHPGEIAPLARLARPHVAAITTVAAVHLEAFEDVDGIAREKAAIFDGLEPAGVAILPGEIDTTPILLAAADARAGRVETFGAGEANTLRLTHLDLTDVATVAQIEIGDVTHLVRIATPGRHFAMNAVAVLGAVRALGGDVTLAARDLSFWTPPEGRGTRETILLDAVEHEGIILIDDAFNANPTSMAAALEVLAATRPDHGIGRIARGRRIAVLGDMLELGDGEAALHAGLAALPHLAEVDLVHCAGPLMRHLWEALPAEKQGRWSETAEELAADAHHLIDAGDVLLVKGSKGSRVSRVVDAVRKLGHPQGA